MLRLLSQSYFLEYTCLSLPNLPHVLLNAVSAGILTLMCCFLLVLVQITLTCSQTSEQEKHPVSSLTCNWLIGQLGTWSQQLLLHSNAPHVFNCFLAPQRTHTSLRGLLLNSCVTLTVQRKGTDSLNCFWL